MIQGAAAIIPPLARFGQSKCVYLAPTRLAPRKRLFAELRVADAKREERLRLRAENEDAQEPRSASQATTVDQEGAEHDSFFTFDEREDGDDTDSHAAQPASSQETVDDGDEDGEGDEGSQDTIIPPFMRPLNSDSQ